MSHTPGSGKGRRQPQTSPDAGMRTQAEHRDAQRAAPSGSCHTSWKMLSTLQDSGEVALARATRKDGSDIVSLGRTSLTLKSLLQLMAFECLIHHYKGVTR